MFLQKQRYNEDRQQSFSPQLKNSTRLEDVVKRMSIPEIKGHQKGNQNLNTRTYLIQYTKKIIKEESKHKKQQNDSFCESQTDYLRLQSRQKKVNQGGDLSRRESRTAAARFLRQRITKRSDITPLLKAQQDLDKSRQSEDPYAYRKKMSSERVARYQDMLKEFSEEIKAQKIELITNHHYQRMPKYCSSSPIARLNSARNPQIQVTNISFTQDQVQELSPRILINRQKRRDLNKRVGHMSYTSYGRRPSKANNSNLQNDEFIEPW